MIVLTQNVAILILLELTLQSICNGRVDNWDACRNPYFIGINSAIKLGVEIVEVEKCRNPYFIGINSAIRFMIWMHFLESCRNPYFIGINSAINILPN